MLKKLVSLLPTTAILLLAAFLRLYRIGDYMTFLGDEGRDVLVAYNILHGHFTLLGPTSSVGGFFLGPIYYYFMAPFLWLFNYNPVGPAVMVALFGIATVWLVYKIGKEFFDTVTGLIAAFLYAISPLVIAYSRSSWNPNLMPFFTLVTLYTLYRALRATISVSLKEKIVFPKRSIILFLLSGFLFGITMQLHYLATFVGVIMGCYVLVIYRKQILAILKSYLLLFVGFLVGFSPFLAFEVRHGFPNIRSIVNFVFHSPEVTAEGNFFGTISNVFFRIFGRLVTDFPPPEQVSLQAHPNIAVWYWLTLVLGLASFGYFIWQFLRELRNINHASREEKFLQYSLLLLWVALGILLFGFYKKTIYDYYFAFMFPLPFLLVGFFISFLIKKQLLLKILAATIFIAIGYINLQAIPFKYAPNRQLQQTETIAQFVLQQTHGQQFNFALITGGNSDHAYRYFFTVWGDPPVTILNPIDDPKRTSVTNQLLVVCETLPCSPLGYSLWEVAGFGRAEIVGKWDVSVVQVYKLKHYTGK